jgi:hypothetical protein
MFWGPPRPARPAPGWRARPDHARRGTGGGRASFSPPLLNPERRRRGAAAAGGGGGAGGALPTADFAVGRRNPNASHQMASSLIYFLVFWGWGLVCVGIYLSPGAWSYDHRS